jgi:hypothetical protein
MMFVVIMVKFWRIMKMAIINKLPLVIGNRRDIIDVKDDWKRMVMVL